MALDAQYASTPQIALAQVTTANTARDGTGTIVDIVTAASTGSRIEVIDIQAIATTTAGMIRLFLYTGAAYRLYREIPVPAITPSATLPAYAMALMFGDMVPLILKSGWKLAASTEKTETFNITAIYGDF